MGCNCARFIVGACNVAIIVAALVAGVYLYVTFKKQDWADFIKNQVPAQFILAVACFAMISAIFGIFAACCKPKCCRVVYLVLIIIVIMLEAVGVTIAILYDDKILAQIEEHWYDKDMTSAKRAVEAAFQCCGFTNTTAESEEQRLDTCGYAPKEGKPTSATPFCKDAILDKVKSNLKAIMIAGIVLVVFQLVLLFCAIYLVCSKKIDDTDSGIAKF